MLVALGVLGLASGPLAGCAPRSKAASDAAAPAAAPPASEAPGEIDALTRELDEYEAQLRARGLALDTDDDAAPVQDEGGDAMQAGPRDADRCSRVCELATAICDLQARVCDLATDHPGEARYSDVCTRAEGDCAVATQACEECGGG